MMFRLTQIVTTSKAPQQTGVNQIVKLVTLILIMEAQAAKFRKQILGGENCMLTSE